MKEQGINLSTYKSEFSFTNKLLRLIWNTCYWIIYRPFSLGIFNSWRIFLLKTFGATIGKHTIIYASARIWAPWNLSIGTYSSIGPKVDCYNQGKIWIGNHSIVSQKVYLCASTHDYKISSFPLIKKPISIGDQVWIAADAFIGPGVNIGNGAVIGARSAVFTNIGENTVAGGNPAKFIKERF